MPFLTSPAILKQIAKYNKYKLCTNELFYDRKTDRIYLAWRGFISDNYTWLNSSSWDTRVAHIHDVACQYHQLVYIDRSNFKKLESLLILTPQNEVYCKDIPIDMLMIEDISKKKANDLFARMMKEANCPSIPIITQILYHIGVAFNLHWFFTGKTKINLFKIYT